MSKYIIELDENTVKAVQTIGTLPHGAIHTHTIDVEDLEELSSDYINEHYGDLQDVAYQRGLEDGKKATWGVVADASNAEYQKGLNDAWECAKKMTWTEKHGGYGERLSEIFERTDTFDFFDYTPNEAIAKLKAFEQKQGSSRRSVRMQRSGSLR